MTYTHGTITVETDCKTHYGVSMTRVASWDHTVVIAEAYLQDDDANQWMDDFAAACDLDASPLSEMSMHQIAAHLAADYLGTVEPGE